MWRRPGKRLNPGNACRYQYSGQHVTARQAQAIGPQKQSKSVKQTPNVRYTVFGVHVAIRNPGEAYTIK